MTEPIQWGGEPRDIGLREVYFDLDEQWGFDERRAVAEQIRLIGQFWDEVNRLYERAQLYDEINRKRGHDATLEPADAAWDAGRLEALEDILELSKKYPFG